MATKCYSVSLKEGVDYTAPELAPMVVNIVVTGVTP